MLRVHELSHFDGLTGEWSALLERCPAATPFQSPEWLVPWWRYLGRGRLWVLALRNRERLVGLAPLCVRRFYGTPLRQVCFLGTGGTDYLDLLSEPGEADAAAALVLDHLHRHRHRWDFCDFQQLPAGSPLLAAPAPPGVCSEAERQEVCPVLSLPSTVDALHAALSPRLRSNLAYSRRRLERETDTRFETAAAATLDEFLEALFRLHAARWSRRRLPGVFRGERVRRFHEAAAGGFLERGWLRLHGLRLNGKLAAVLYCFQQGGRAYYYGGGFDPDLARFSPGSLLTAYAIEDAVRSGAAEFDFLRGDEPYKYRWGAADQPNHRRLLWRPSARGSLAPPAVRAEQGAERLVKSAARRLSGGAPYHGGLRTDRWKRL